MRALQSCITEITVQGAVVDLNYIGMINSSTDKNMGPSDCAEKFNQPQLLAGLNEALAWRKVIPFVPNMSGELITYI